MSANRNVRRDRGLHQVRKFAHMNRIIVLTIVGKWPAIESAVLYRCDVVGNKVVAQVISLVDGSPKRVRARLPSQRRGIAQTGSEDPEARSIGVVFADRGPADVFAFGIIGCRSDSDIDLSSVAAEGS